MSEKISGQELFGGNIRNIDVNLGINQNPTVVTVTIVKDTKDISINNRSLVDIKLGEFEIRGIVQSWTQSKIDVAGTGVYRIRITDTKPVLSATSVVLGSPYDNSLDTSISYGDNVVGIVPKNNKQIKDGVEFENIKTVIEETELRYGGERYRVKFDFVLPSKGSSVSYNLKNRAMSLIELISQIANDYGLDWYVTTSPSNIISIKMFGRTNITNFTVNQLISLHQGKVVRRHEGLENRDAIQKVVLIGGLSSFLHKVPGDLWEQFWGLSSLSEIRSSPVFNKDLMTGIINNTIDSELYTKETLQKAMSYANEFWGRKFIAPVTPEAALDSNGESWVVPVSAAWNNNSPINLDFDSDGLLKFQTEDGRWSTFVNLPLPGVRFPNKSSRVEFEWDDELYNNPNSYISDKNVVSIKSSLEIMTIDSKPYFLLTLGTPLRVVALELILEDNTQTITKVRAEFFEDAFIALMDKRTNYGPWTNSSISVGKTEVIIDSSLTPWEFGYRGISNTQGTKLLNQVAFGRLKTISDTVMDMKTAEIEVAGLPAMNIGDRLQNTGAITSLQIVFGINGVRTIYKSLQFTNELSKHVRKQQDLLDKLRRQAAEFNNTMQPPNNNLISDEIIRTLKKELPELPVNISSEGIQNDLNKTLLGRIATRTSLSEPKYNITPMIWQSDAFGELTLVRDPQRAGIFLNVVNMGEKQTSRGRLTIGTDVQVNTFSVTKVGVTSYYIDVSAPPPPNFTATIIVASNPNTPIYAVTPVVDSVQQINLLSSELISLNYVPNLGEPINMAGFLPVGTEVSISWNELSDGSYTPFMEQQLNMFRPPN